MLLIIIRLIIIITIIITIPTITILAIVTKHSIDNSASRPCGALLVAKLCSCSGESGTILKAPIFIVSAVRFETTIHVLAFGNV